MNAPITSSNPSFIQSIDSEKIEGKNALANHLLIRSVLCWFGKTRLDANNVFFKNTDYDQQFAIQSHFPLSQFSDHYAEIFNQQLEVNEHLNQLAKLLHLKPEELFLLYLCVQLEDDYWLNLALQELQGAGEFPQLHFISELVAELFACHRSPSQWSSSALFRLHILQLHSDGPLALSACSLQRELWPLLSSKISAESCVEKIQPPMSDTKNENEFNADLLMEHAIKFRSGGINWLGITTDKQTLKHFSCALGGMIGLTPVFPSTDLLAKPDLLNLLAKLYQWLPIISLDLESNQFTSSGRFVSQEQSPRILYSDKTIDLEKIPVEYLSQGVVLRMTETLPEQRRALYKNQLQVALAEKLSRLWLLNTTQIQRLLQQLPNHFSKLAQNQQEDILRRLRLAMAPDSLSGLAYQLTQKVDAHSVVLTTNLKKDLTRFISRCHQRESLFTGLGHSTQATQTTGLKTLFAGESGTGKTLAAIFIANELGIPIYRLDLGSVLNKYIGETEKNIHRLFEEAAQQDYIILIDEADALLGKRTDSEATGERFSNMLTNYLLTRIENYPGIVIMTTNGLGRIDHAFLRRFDSVIHFASPELEERAKIWQSHLGDRSPGEAVCRQLASLCDLSGGFIRNAVLTAAAESPIQDQLEISYESLLRSLAIEYRKSSKPLPPKMSTQLLSFNINLMD